MPDQNNEELHKRISRLEQRVQELEQKVGEASGKAESSVSEVPPTDERAKSNRVQDRLGEAQFGEQWLNRLGIGLLLIGVVFLFKYTIDQGWLVPPVRSAIGLGIGGLLFGAGLRMDEQMNPFRQLLLGGGIAVFYITGFATFQLYSFLPDVLIWAFMIVVTLLALSLSLQQDEAVLSVTGIVGALGTPFMLYTGSGGIGILVVYTTLVLSAAAVIYYQKGWNSLLWSMLVGGFCVMVVGVLASMFDGQSLSVAEHWYLQVGIIVWALSTWGGGFYYAISNPEKEYGSTVHLSTFWVSFWMLPLMTMHWDFSSEGASLLAFGLAVLGIAGYAFLQHRNMAALAFSHGFMALIMSTVGIVLFFEGTLLFILLAAETVVLRYVVTQTGDWKLNFSAHLLFLLVALWVARDLFMHTVLYDTAFTLKSFTQLLFIAAGGTLIPSWLDRADFKQFYRILSHLLLLYWIYQMFGHFSDGQAWITVFWGLYAIGLLVVGFTIYGKRVRLVGMGTLFLVVAKLFLVDLAQLQALWRILLFIGFGGALILLGYYLQSKWNHRESEV
ncbi:DUF2339 domain-containing protein [Fodinibius salsisoli]|uniref:DUF2339 domain-containing protein n=1 Tax=Fodinibius salsisoli TaxID=2820877 RepID=A0ABT3PM04_9BACT|nr:DUF2339 domain-containing protein [Fodinibius salsisoli]MCW9706952.1 DUF2339 domain-containing protein [Fodinibius salsisoli]